MTFLWRVGGLFLGAMLLAASAMASPSDSTAFDDGPAPFAVQFGEHVISHRIMAVTAMPNASVALSVEDDKPGAGYLVTAPEETVTPISDQQWLFSAPSTPGLHSVTVTDTTTRTAVRLQVFVLTPWNHDQQRLDGFRIGQYQQRALRGLERYEPPAGFIRVTAENEDVRVSPNFRLDQFLCKQTETTPQFLLVQTRLLQRLEKTLAALNDRGHDVSTLHVMSAYRTPYYNRSIGNTTEYSRHLYGDAADVFVDETGNQWMDDLNGDGRIDRADAQYLARIVRSVPTPGDDQFNGGLGIYGSASHRGPFVHVDLRGHRARW